MRRRIAAHSTSSRRSRTRAGLLATCGAMFAALVIMAGPAGAQSCMDLLESAPIGSGCMETPEGAFLTEPSGGFGSPSSPSSGAGGFGALFAIALVAGIGISIWKFVSIRDMGMRRGMSSSDATKAAMFSDDAAMLGMVLKDERDDPEERPRSVERHDETDRAPRAAATSPPPDAPAPPSIESRLEEINRLRTKGLITAAQADERKAEILDEI